jgi:hypothetical protein
MRAMLSLRVHPVGKNVHALQVLNPGAGALARLCFGHHLVQLPPYARALLLPGRPFV